MVKSSIVLIFLLFIVSGMNSNLTAQTATPPAAGDGSIGNPYEIATLNNLYWITLDDDRWEKHYIQTEDINASSTSSWVGGAGFLPIGNENYGFTGTYNGQDHTIEGLYINRPYTDYVGLFGRIQTNDQTSTIQNLGVKNVNIIGNIYVGGLIGFLIQNSSVSTCFSTGIVNGYHSVGGLVGSDDLSTVSNSFWDMQTSGQGGSYGGTGKTTDDLKTESISGWGWSTDIWERIGYNYPCLINNPDPTLPVELSAFTAQYIENTPTIHWTTQSETDNMGWFVYRNEENDFTTSEKISDFIDGHGTTTQQQSYVYEDRIQNPEAGDTYYYWLESIDYSGIVSHYDRVAVLTIPEQYDPGSGIIPVPEPFGLFQNEPNPVISSTKISFNLPEAAQVELAIYNLKGQLVKSLYSGVTSAKTSDWNGKGENGNDLNAGVYFNNLIVNDKTSETKKLILMK